MPAIVSKIEPGQLWMVNERTAMYPADNGLPAIKAGEVGEVVLILGKGSAAGLYGPHGYVQVLYQERVWEINSSLFENDVMTLCQ